MSILIIGVNYWLIPIFGIEGAAMGSAGVMLLFNLIKYGYLKAKIQLDPFSQETVKIGAVGLISLGGMFLSFEDLHPFLGIIIKSTAVLLLFLIGSIGFGVGKEEWKWIKSKVKKSGPQSVTKPLLLTRFELLGCRKLPLLSCVLCEAPSRRGEACFWKKLHSGL